MRCFDKNSRQSRLRLSDRSRTLSVLMLDYIAEANQEKAAVLGVFLVFIIFALLTVGGLLGCRPSLQ